MKAETSDDVKNVEAWAEVITDVLDLVPIDRRAKVLALALQNEEAERAEREARDGALAVLFLEQLQALPLEPVDETIMRLKSLVVQVFVRRIRNSHSPKVAAQILFAQHRYGRGSGLLGDYILDLPKNR